MTSAERIKQRVKHLHERVERLKSFQAYTLEEYLSDFKLRDAVERNFQVAIESCADIAGYLIAEYGLEQPIERRAVFYVLAGADILENDFADMMAQAVSLRNRLVHLYMTIEPAKMYYYLQNDVVHFERFEALTLAALDEAQE
ncbi:MAG TPA: DUF86 domain-containing protein [Chloroflexi bacterium]|nr:DUF86 domain-containing protein [Chloroflexota bacterium]